LSQHRNIGGAIKFVNLLGFLIISRKTTQIIKLAILLPKSNKQRLVIAKTEKSSRTCSLMFAGCVFEQGQIFRKMQIL
jgi:hypothetical protein